jgi:hypothetical protein
VRITRRHLVASSIAAASVGAMGGGLAVRWWDRPKASHLKALSEDEHHFVQMLAEAAFPPGGDPALSGADARLGDFMDETVAWMEPQQGKLFRLLLQAMDDRPTPLWLAPFSSLDLPSRMQILGGWVNSEYYLIRSSTAGVTALLSFGWMTHPQVAERMKPLVGCAYGR